MKELNQSPNYHDVLVIVDGKQYRICDDYSLELACTRVSGWRLWRNGTTLIGGEYDSAEFRIEVAGTRLVKVGEN